MVFREINISERGVMKKIKRMMAMAIVIAIILSLGVSNMAFGAVPTTQSFDENNAANADGKYTIY